MAVGPVLRVLALRGMTPKKRVGGFNEKLRNEFQIDRARRRRVAGASALEMDPEQMRETVKRVPAG